MKIIKTYLTLFLLCLAKPTFALPLIITPQGSLPTSVAEGLSVIATYTVTNNTSSPKTNISLKYLPLNITPVYTGIGVCSETFSLTAKGQPGDSCILTLQVNGAIDASDPDPHHHLFVCMDDQLTCSGPQSPLSVRTIHPPTYAFVSNLSANQVLMCSISYPEGIFDCQDAGNPGAYIHDPYQIALKTVGNQNYAYITQASGQVIICLLKPDKTFDSCAPDNYSFGSPGAIILNKAQTRAYILNFLNDGAYECSIDPSGASFNGCNLIANVHQGAGIALNEDKHKAYMTTWHDPDLISQCNTDTGSAWDCANVDMALIEPHGLILNHANSLAYFTNKDENLITQCMIDNAGNFTDHCQVENAQQLLNQPFGITLTKDEDAVYIVNFGDSKIIRCAVNTFGGFSQCQAIMNSGAPFANPLFVAFGY